MKDFLTNVVKNIVEQPDAVVVTETTDQGGRITLTISVADNDMGRVIGKDGKVINAIRMIMRVMAIRQNVRVRVDLEDRQEDDSQEIEAPAAVEQAEVTAPTPVAQPQQQAPAQAPQQQPVAEPAQAPQQPTAADFVGQPQTTTTVVDNSNKQ